VPEQHEAAVHHDHVPLDGNTHGNAARDEGVKEEHHGQSDGRGRSAIAHDERDRKRVFHDGSCVRHEMG
jgi:hypothetical protein